MFMVARQLFKYFTDWLNLLAFYSMLSRSPYTHCVLGNVFLYLATQFGLEKWYMYAFADGFVCTQTIWLLKLLACSLKNKEKKIFEAETGFVIGGNDIVPIHCT